MFRDRGALALLPLADSRLALTTHTLSLSLSLSPDTSLHLIPQLSPGWLALVCVALAAGAAASFTTSTTRRLADVAVTSAQPPSLSPNDTLTIVGSNFAAGATVLLRPPSGPNLPCSRVVVQSSTHLSCVPPIPTEDSLLEVPLSVLVSVSGSPAATLPAAVEFARPTVRDARLARSSRTLSNRTTLLLWGSSLRVDSASWSARGLSAPADIAPYVSFGPLTCANPVFEADELLSCTLPADVEGRGVALDATLLDALSVNTTAFRGFFEAPLLERVDPPVLLLRPPSDSSPQLVTLRLSGTRFGRTSAQVRSVSFAQFPCPSLRWMNDSTLDCEDVDLRVLRQHLETQRGPLTASVEVPIELTWGEVGFESVIATEVSLTLGIRPVFHRVVPPTIQPGDWFTIHGSALGWSSADIDGVRVGPAPCLRWRLVSPEVLHCQGPPISQVGQDPAYPRLRITMGHTSGSTALEPLDIEYPRDLYVGFHEQQERVLFAVPSGYGAFDVIPLEPALRIVALQVPPTRCWLEMTASTPGVALVGNTSFSLQLTVDDLPLALSFSSVGVTGPWGSSASLTAMCSTPSGDVEGSSVVVQVLVLSPTIAWESAREAGEPWPAALVPETSTPGRRIRFDLDSVDEVTLPSVERLFACSAVLREGDEATSEDLSINSILETALLAQSPVPLGAWDASKPRATSLLELPTLPIRNPVLGRPVILEVECEWTPSRARLRLPPLQSAVVQPTVRWDDGGVESFSLSGTPNTWSATIDHVSVSPAAARAVCAVEEDIASSALAAASEARIELAPSRAPDERWRVALVGTVIGRGRSWAMLRASCVLWGQRVQSPARQLVIDELVTELVDPFPSHFLPSSANSFFTLEPVPAVRVRSALSGNPVLANLTCSLRSRNSSLAASVDGPAAFVPVPGSAGRIPLAGVALRSQFGLRDPVSLEVACATSQRHDAIPLFVSITVAPLVVRWCVQPASVAQSQSPIRPFSAAVVDTSVPGAFSGPCTSLEAPAEFSARTDNLLSCSIAQVAGADASVSETVLQNSFALPDPATWLVHFRSFSLAGDQGSTYALQLTCQLGSLFLTPTLAFDITLDGCNPGEEPQGFFCRKCEAGAFSLGGVGEKCVGCPSRGVTCTNGIIELQPGFYRVESQWGEALGPDTELHPCWNQEACVVDVENRTYGCVRGHSGALCGVCDMSQGYARFGKACALCWPEWANVTVLGCLCLVFFGVAGVLALRSSNGRRSDAAIILRMLLSYVQGLGALGVFKARGTETFREVFGFSEGVSMNPFSLGPIQCLFNLPFLVRFVLVIALPLMAALTVIIVFVAWTYLRALVHALQRLLGRRVATPSGPPLDTVTTFFRERRYLASISFLAFLAYMPMVTQAFQAIDCYDEPIDGVSRLNQDLSETCPQVGLVMLAGIVLAIVGVGLPLGLYVVLKRTPEKELLDARFMDHYGFLYDGYDLKRELAWWESVVLVRKAGIVMLSTLITDAFVQLSGALLLLAFSLWLNERWKPYSKARFVKIESESLAVLFVTAAMSLVYFRDIEDEDGNVEELSTTLNFVLTVLLVGLNIGMLVRMTVELVRKQGMELIRTTPIGRKIASFAGISILTKSATAGPSTFTLVQANPMARSHSQGTAEPQKRASVLLTTTPERLAFRPTVSKGLGRRPPRPPSSTATGAPTVARLGGPGGAAAASSTLAASRTAAAAAAAGVGAGPGVIFNPAFDRERPSGTQPRG